MLVLVKQPAETLRPELVSAGAVAIVSVATSARGLVSGSAALAAAAELAGGALLLDLSGGTDGERYLVTVRYETIEGETREGELEVAVIDGAWVMPDGGAPYLSIAEFVGRFGLREAVEMTDGEGGGRIDRAYLIGALVAAQGAVDLSLAARYALPLTTVPETIKGLVADLARARLYPRGVPEGVAVLARSAEKALERIASGALPLPLPAGETAAGAVSDTPVLISTRGRREYPAGFDWS